MKIKSSVSTPEASLAYAIERIVMAAIRPINPQLGFIFPINEVLREIKKFEPSTKEPNDNPTVAEMESLRERCFSLGGMIYQIGNFSIARGVAVVTCKADAYIQADCCIPVDCKFLLTYAECLIVLKKFGCENPRKSGARELNTKPNSDD